MSYQREITTNEELNHDKFSMTNRLSPIGSASSDTEYDRRSCFNEECNENIALLEEHEKLNAALAALTRHVAHVQFRLEQVLSAPTPEDREVKKNIRKFFFLSLFYFLEFTFTIT
jgi:hypothetical protein